MNLIDNDIYDIKFLNNETYLLKTNTLSSKDIENSIINFKYSGERLLKDETVENSKLPPFITMFYKYIFEKNQIPTENNLFEYYFNTYYLLNSDNKTCSLKENLKNNYCKLNNLSVEGIKARLLRSYPSFIRDFHFFKLCSENKTFTKVIYSLNTDYFDGYDLIIDYNGCKYAVSLFIETNRGNYYKGKKQNRHKYDQYKEIILTINRNECKNVGRFYLYTQSHVEKLIKLLQQSI